MDNQFNPKPATNNSEKTKLPILNEHSVGIRENPGIKSPHPGDFTPVFANDVYRAHSFLEVKKAFEFIYDKDRIVKCLDEEPSKENYAYLKDVRRYALILKAMYKLFDSNHRSPDDLQSFIFSLGKYNDAYRTEFAEEVKSKVKTIDTLHFPFHGVSTQEFKEYVSTMLLKISALLQQRTLPVEDFHKLRQKIRFLADMLQVSAAEGIKGNIHWLFYSMMELSGELGDQHDKLVRKDLKGKIDYDKEVIEVDPYLVFEFNTLKPYIEKVSGLRN